MTRVLMYPGRVRADDNPFISILGAGLSEAGVLVSNYSFGRAVGGADVLHIHWLEQIFWGRIAKRMPLIAASLALGLVLSAMKFRRERKPVVWTVHNLRPHEGLRGWQRSIYDKLRAALLPLVTDVILMSESIAEEVDREFPEISGARKHVVVHPSYQLFYADLPREPSFFNGPSEAARVPKLVTAGMIRPYKGIVQMISAAKRLPCDFSLVIAGDGCDETCRLIAEGIEKDDRFRFIRKRLTHSELGSLLRDADGALFNFQSVLNSGSVLAALSVDTPVLCPKSGALRSLGAELGPEWVCSFEGELTGDIIEGFLRKLDLGLHRRCPLENYSPLVVGSRHREIYESGKL